MLKMRSFFVALLLLTLVAGFPSQAMAQNPWTKLGRGFANLLFGYGEIVRQVTEMAETERWPIAVAGGLWKGIIYGTGRTFVGAFELLTFPIPSYEPILDPDFSIPVEPHYAEDKPVWGEHEIQNIY